MKSSCRYRVAALGFSRKGDFLGVAFNTPRDMNNYEGQTHAEMALIHKFSGVRSIIILRVGKTGIIRPIDPCSRCLSVLNKLEIKVRKII